MCLSRDLVQLFKIPHGRGPADFANASTRISPNDYRKFTTRIRTGHIIRVLHRYTRGVSSRLGVPMSMNLGSLLHARATERPHQTALFCGSEAMSYQALDETTTRLAEWFLAQGLRAGDRVALHWSNSLEVVQLF